MNYHQTYVRTLRDLRSPRGWLQREFELDGKKCLVGALGSNLTDPAEILEYRSGRALPADMLAEIDSVIRRRYPAYAVKRFGRGLPEAAWLWRWNDAPWRSHADVVALLERLVELSEPGWLREERSRLVGEVAALQMRVDALEAELKETKAMNRGLMSRLRASRRASADEAQVEELMAELSARWDELAALPPLPAKSK